MSVHVFYYLGGHDVFQDLAKDASKGYWTVVYSLRFVTLFEHWCYVSLTPLYGKFSCFDRSLKMTWIIGEISSLSSLRINGLILSGPAALLGFKLPRSFIIPLRPQTLASWVLGFEDPGNLNRGLSYHSRPWPGLSYVRGVLCV